METKVNTALVMRFLAFETNQRCIVRAPDGTIWIFYGDNETRDAEDLLIAYSKDGGKTWTEETVLEDAVLAGQGAMCLMVDSNSVPHIVYAYWSYYGGNRYLKYLNRVGGSWSTPETIDTGGVGARMPRCGIDSNDVIHIAYSEAGEIRYIYGTAGNWSSYETVDAGVSGSSSLLDAIINSNNEPAVLIVEGIGGGADNGTFIRVRSGGSWSARDKVMDYKDDFWFTFCLDSKDNYYVAFVWDWDKSPTGYCTIGIISKINGVWGSKTEVVNSGEDWEDYSMPLLAVDVEDNIYIIYSRDRGASDETIWWKKMTSAGVLGDEQTLADDFLQPNGFPCTYTALWHRFPTSGILTPKFHPAVALLTESPVNNYDADLYFLAPLAVISKVKGNPNIDQRMFQHVERMER